jgi:hypothetical protein
MLICQGLRIVGCVSGRQFSSPSLIEEQNKNDNNSQADEYTDNEGETIISSLFFGRG